MGLAYDDDDPDWINYKMEELKCTSTNETLNEIKHEHEKVNHPKHYNRENALEAIDEMLLIFGKDAVKNFCLCNAWKYRYRAADKNGEEDIKKSDWYIRKYKELCEEPSIKNIDIKDIYSNHNIITYPTTTISDYKFSAPNWGFTTTAMVNNN